MRTFLILTASALLFAAAIVEISSRLWPDSHLALLALAAAALFAQGLLGSRVIAATPSAPGAAPAPSRREAPRQPARPKSSGSKDQRAAATPATGADAGRESGSVKWFNRSKGFGFIIRESGEEIFVHQRSIRSEGAQSEGRRPTLKDGQAVTFVVVERDKGKQAEDVVPGT